MEGSGEEVREWDEEGEERERGGGVERGREEGSLKFELKLS